MGQTSGTTVVIGAGIGGLVAALELAHAGLPVTLIDKAAGPGGKMRTIATEAGPVDAGPTVFTLRPIFEGIFRAVGEDLDRHLTLSRAGLLARHHWRDGGILDLHACPLASEAAIAAFSGPRDAAAFRAFHARTRYLFDTLESPMMQAAAPTPLGVTRRLLPDLPRLLPAAAPLSSLWQLLARQFHDPRLRQLFARYATYVGGSPFLSPALLSLIWQAEARGVWLVEGGMAALARTLEALCRARGVTIRYDTPAAGIEVGERGVTGVRLATGEVLAATRIVFNGDPAALAAGLLGAGAQRAAPALPRARRSLSACVWTFAGTPAGFDLAHHNVFFGDDYRTEFDDLFRYRRLPRDPTIYVCAQDRDGPGAAGQTPERFQILMNAPADGDTAAPTEQEIRACETRTFTRLAEAGLMLTPPQAQGALTTPQDFNRLFPGTGGALYGANPHGAMASFRRPQARTPLAGLYLAGGGAHPGPGVPMAALSGRHAAAAILRDLGSTSRSRRTDTPGGTSMAFPTTEPAAFRSSGS